MFSVKNQLSHSFDTLRSSDSFRAGRKQLQSLKRRTNDTFSANSITLAKQNKMQKSPKIRVSNGLSSGLGEFVIQFVTQIATLPLLLLN